jgi:ABC-type uncharacterized transport system substrate-binding protein
LWRIGRDPFNNPRLAFNNCRPVAGLGGMRLIGCPVSDRGLCPARSTPYLGTMRAVRLVLSILAMSLVVPPAWAHPHIFVDAGLRLMRDAEGRVVAVEVTWRYDELYSLILTEDYGLDPDYDLQLTEAEVAETLGFDLNWSGGFEGGLVLRQGGETLEVGPPEPVSLSMLDTGQLQTTHRRPVLGGMPGAEIAAQIYDPEFYIAFEMILDVGVAGAPDCAAELIRADLDAAYAVLESALDEIGGVVAAEDNFPAVGAYFADRVVISCPE